MEAHTKMTDEELEALGSKLATLHRDAVDAWGEVIGTLPINSPVRRQLANAGRGIQSGYLALKVEAEDRGWGKEEIREVFSSNTNCAFN